MLINLIFTKHLHFQTKKNATSQIEKKLAKRHIEKL